MFGLTCISRPRVCFTLLFVFLQDDSDTEDDVTLREVRKIKRTQ